MKNDMNINETITELDRISSLYDQYQSLSSAMDNLVDEKKAEEESLAKEIVETLKEFREKQDKKFSAKKPNIAPACLSTPPKSPTKPNTKNPTKDLFVGVISGLIAMFSVAFWLIMVIINPDNSALGLIFLSVFLMIGSVAFWLVKGAGNVTMFVEWQKNHKGY